MKKILPLLLMLCCMEVSPHPGIGIVRDSKGNTFYTDLVHVWKISASGKKTIAVKNVHTHELYMDENDNLFGEHLWYNGEKLNTWGHYVWRLNSNKNLDTIIKPTAGFLKNYSFVRDGNANMYWVENDSISAFKRMSANGQVNILLRGNFKDVRWMHATQQGSLYFTDLDHLYKIGPGKLILIAKNISQNTPAFAIHAGKHSLLGIWTDDKENVYLANFSGQVVKRISASGKVFDFVYTTKPWSPTGGTFDKEGNLWLLEYSLTNEARVRKISPDVFNKGKTKSIIVSNYTTPPAMVAVIATSVLLMILYLFKRKRKPALTPLY